MGWRRRPRSVWASGPAMQCVGQRVRRPFSKLPGRPWLQHNVCACTHTVTHAHTRTRTHARTHAHTHTHTHTHARTHIHTHTHTHTVRPRSPPHPRCCTHRLMRDPQLVMKLHGSCTVLCPLQAEPPRHNPVGNGGAYIHVCHEHRSLWYTADGSRARVVVGSLIPPTPTPPGCTMGTTPVRPGSAAGAHLSFWATFTSRPELSSVNSPSLRAMYCIISHVQRVGVLVL